MTKRNTEFQQGAKRARCVKWPEVEQPPFPSCVAYLRSRVPVEVWTRIRSFLFGLPSTHFRFPLYSDILSRHLQLHDDVTSSTIRKSYLQLNPETMAITLIHQPTYLSLVLQLLQQTDEKVILSFVNSTLDKTHAHQVLHFTRTRNQYFVLEDSIEKESATYENDVADCYKPPEHVAVPIRRGIEKWTAPHKITDSAPWRQITHNEIVTTSHGSLLLHGLVEEPDGASLVPIDPRFPVYLFRSIVVGSEVVNTWFAPTGKTMSLFFNEST